MSNGHAMNSSWVQDVVDLLTESGLDVEDQIVVLEQAAARLVKVRDGRTAHEVVRGRAE